MGSWMEKLVQLKVETNWFWLKVAVVLAAAAIVVAKPRN